MAAVTVSRRRTNVAGNRKIRQYTITIAADGDTLDTRLRTVENVSIRNPQEPFTVTGTLVGGTLAITDTRITANCKAIVGRVSNAGTDGHLEAVCTADTVTIASSSGADTSICDVLINPPHVSGVAISGGTLTFDLNPSVSTAGVRVEVTGI